MSNDKSIRETAAIDAWRKAPVKLRNDLIEYLREEARFQRDNAKDKRGNYDIDACTEDAWIADLAANVLSEIKPRKGR